jgi:hypothetical protein
MFNISKSRNEYSHSFISSSVILILMTFLFISLLPEISYSDRIWVSFISAKGGSKDGEQGAPPEISIIQSNDVHTLVHVTIPGMWVDTIMGPDGQVYQKLEVPDYATTNDVGLPELPAIRGLLGIPDNAQVSMIPQVYETQILDNYYVWPHQRPICDGEIPVFEKNIMFYNSNSWFPLNHNEVGEPGIFKYYTVDNVGYIPFSYNPYLRQLNVSYEYEVDVIYNNGGTIPQATMDEDMANLMRGVIWNFDSLDPNIDNYAPVYYLIIVPDYLYNDEVIGEFAKRLQDRYSYYTIDIKKYDDDTGSGDVNLKNYIKTYYNNHEKRLDYVLFIGDADNIPIYNLMNSWGYYSDYYYTLLTETQQNPYIIDVYPDIALGRFSFNKYDVNQLYFQFLKEEIYYEQEWDNDVLLVAHKENDAGMSFFKQAENIGITGKYDMPFPVFKKCYGLPYQEGYDPNIIWNATNGDVEKCITDGVASVCYNGHGLQNRWDKWNNRFPPENWTELEIWQLENYSKLTVVFNCCCWNGKINYDTGNCLCESWMLGDYYNTQSLGAVATMGHTEESWSLYCEKNVLMEEVYKNIYGCRFPPRISGVKKGLGWIINMATVKDIITWSIERDPMMGAVVAIRNAIMRILLGDPALRMRTGREYSDNKNIYSKENMPDKINNLSNIEVNITNPVYEDINIYIKTDREESVNIDIYDISGRRINRLYCGKINTGDNCISINNNDLKTGLYILNIFSDSFDIVKKIVVIR